MRRFLERVLSLLRLRHSEDDLDREISAHLRLLQDGFEADGMTAESASRAARIALGGVERTKQLHREARSFLWLEDVRQDATHGVRLLRRSALFNVTAAMSIAIGIGANTAIFTVANALLFSEPAGVVDSGELVDLGVSRGDGGLNPLSYPTFLEVAGRITSLSAVFAQQMTPHAMSLMTHESTAAEPLLAQYVTPNFFSVLGVSPAVGRMVAEGDDAVAILDYSYWKRRFAGDRSVIGRSLRINGRLIEVVGVAAEGFRGTGIQDRDAWLTIGQNAKDVSSVIAGGRRRPGVETRQVAAELAVITDTLNGQTSRSRREFSLRAVPFSRAAGNRNVVLGSAAALMLIVSIVLAIASANVAGLLLTRWTSRAREIALRKAIGAARNRLARQLLTEVAVLFLLGGVLGLALAKALLTLTPLVIGASFPSAIPLTLDWRVLIFALSVSLLAALMAGVLPAMKTSKVDPATVLRDGVGSSAHPRLRNAFLIGQIALSILLLVVAGFFVRAVRYAGSTDPGFDPSGVEVTSVDLSMGNGQEPGISLFWSTLIDRVRHLPTVQAASLVRVPPGGVEGIGLGDAEAEDGLESTPFSPGWNIIDVDYFTTLGIPLLVGRDFLTGDGPRAAPVVIVSENIARRLWRVENAVGKTLVLSLFNVKTRRVETSRATVIGVVGEIKSSSLVDGLAEPFVYLPLAQSHTTGVTSGMSIVAKQRASSPLGAGVVTIIHDIDPALAVAQSVPLSELIAFGLIPQRVFATLTAALGFVGLLLASVGIYGVTAYAVALRHREFGIRLALGAPRANVLWMVVKQGMLLIAIGAGIGLCLAMVAGQVLSAFLYGLPAIHTPLLMSTLVLFLTIGAAACVIPASQAVRAANLIALQKD